MSRYKVSAYSRQNLNNQWGETQRLMYNLSRSRPDKPKAITLVDRKKSAKIRASKSPGCYTSRPSADEIGKIQTIFMPLDNGPYAILPPENLHKTDENET